MNTGPMPRIALNALVEERGASRNAVAPAQDGVCNCGAPGGYVHARMAKCRRAQFTCLAALTLSFRIKPFPRNCKP